MMTSLVRALRSPRRPAAILWLVVAAWVYAVQCESLRARPHVGEERGEVSAPSVAHGDSELSVEGVVAGRWCVAPGFHAAPDRVFALVESVHRPAVFRVAVAPVFALSASATRSISTKQVLPVLGCDNSAIAAADPVRAATFSLRSIALDNGELTESHPGNVFRCSQRHASNYTASVLTVEAKVSA